MIPLFATDLNALMLFSWKIWNKEKAKRKQNVTIVCRSKVGKK